MAISYVQVKDSQSSSGTSINATFDSSVTSGNTIIVLIGWETTATTVSNVTDSQSNSYSQIVPVTSNSGTYHEMWMATGITGGSNTVTVTLGSSASWLDLRILEYVGADTVDDYATAADDSAPYTVGPVTTTVADALIVYGNKTNGWSGTTDSNFSERALTGYGCVAADRIVSSTGNYSFTTSSGGSGNQALQLVALYEGTGGGADVNLTGQAGTLSYGTLSVTGDANYQVTGQSITTSYGSLDAQGSAQRDLTGQDITSAYGDLSPIGNAVYTLTGQQVLSAYGVLNVDTGQTWYIVNVDLDDSIYNGQEGVIVALSGTVSASGKRVWLEQGGTWEEQTVTGQDSESITFNVSYGALSSGAASLYVGNPL